MTITEFLLARVAEDEALARKVEAAARCDFERSSGDYGNADPTQNTDCWHADGNMGDPVFVMGIARVLAECEAKRRIVEEHSDARSPMAIYAEPYCRTCSGDGDMIVSLPCRTLGALALPYADHPEFDPTWSLNG